MSYLDKQRGTGGYFPDEPVPSGPLSSELEGIVLIRNRANSGGWVGYQDDVSFSDELTSVVGASVGGLSFSRDILIFDACLSSTHTRESKITEHPVEKGAAISDHIQPQPRRLQMEVISSATMRDPFHGMSKTRDIEMWNLFEEMWQSQELFYVATNSQDYENMAIESLTRSDDLKTGQKVVVKVTFKEIIQVEPEFVEFPVNLLRDDARPSASAPQQCQCPPEGSPPGAEGSDLGEGDLDYTPESLAHGLVFDPDPNGNWGVPTP